MLLSEIVNNPFRVLGVYADSNAARISSSVSRFSAFIRVNRPLKSDLDLEGLLPPVPRTQQLLDVAAREVATPRNRLDHGMFWFFEGEYFTGKVLPLLKENQPDSAIQMLRDGEKNIENMQNLMILCLITGDIESALEAAQFLFSKSKDSYQGRITDLFKTRKDYFVKRFILALMDNGIIFSSHLKKPHLTKWNFWHNAFRDLVSGELFSADGIKSINSLASDCESHEPRYRSKSIKGLSQIQLLSGFLPGNDMALVDAEMDKLRRLAALIPGIRDGSIKPDIWPSLSTFMALFRILHLALPACVLEIAAVAAALDRAGGQPVNCSGFLGCSSRCQVFLKVLNVLYNFQLSAMSAFLGDESSAGLAGDDNYPFYLGSLFSAACDLLAELRAHPVVGPEDPVVQRIRDFRQLAEGKGLFSRFMAFLFSSGGDPERMKGGAVKKERVAACAPVRDRHDQIVERLSELTVKYDSKFHLRSAGVDPDGAEDEDEDEDLDWDAEMDDIDAEQDAIIDQTVEDAIDKELKTARKTKGKQAKNDLKIDLPPDFAEKARQDFEQLVSSVFDNLIGVFQKERKNSGDSSPSHHDMRVLAPVFIPRDENRKLPSVTGKEKYSSLSELETAIRNRTSVFSSGKFCGVLKTGNDDKINKEVIKLLVRHESVNKRKQMPEDVQKAFEDIIGNSEQFLMMFGFGNAMLNILERTGMTDHFPIDNNEEVLQSIHAIRHSLSVIVLLSVNLEWLLVKNGLKGRPHCREIDMPMDVFDNFIAQLKKFKVAFPKGFAPDELYSRFSEITFDVVEQAVKADPDLEILFIKLMSLFANCDAMLGWGSLINRRRALLIALKLQQESTPQPYQQEIMSFLERVLQAAGSAAGRKKEAAPSDGGKKGRDQTAQGGQLSLF